MTVPWLRLIRPGDWLVILAAASAVGVSFPLLWQGGQGERAIIRQEGRVFLEVALDKARTIPVPGPLGTTVIEIAAGRARVASDPGPRQYCVRQGWLSRAGEIAICAPNRVSLAIGGGQSPYDSLNY
ncbi:MAG: NusG domain II-containing protein [Azovibrio sp.]|uniref:NusG domain II-containing protein n=1 Tax=Azovibrio sp. TaxID=1872673 RepID=UPI003C70F663